MGYVSGIRTDQREQAPSKDAVFEPSLARTIRELISAENVDERRLLLRCHEEFFEVGRSTALIV